MEALRERYRQRRRSGRYASSSSPGGTGGSSGLAKTIDEPTGRSGDDVEIDPGFVKTDEQFTREDLALSAGLRSSVDIAFRTDQIPLDRFARRARIRQIDQRQMVPGSGLLTDVDRETSGGHLRDPGVPPEASDPGSEESRRLRGERDFGPRDGADSTSRTDSAGTSPEGEGT